MTAYFVTVEAQGTHHAYHFIKYSRGTRVVIYLAFQNKNIKSPDDRSDIELFKHLCKGQNIIHVYHFHLDNKWYNWGKKADGVAKYVVSKSQIMCFEFSCTDFFKEKPPIWLLPKKIVGLRSCTSPCLVLVVIEKCPFRRYSHGQTEWIKPVSVRCCRKQQLKDECIVGNCDLKNS